MRFEKDGMLRTSKAILKVMSVSGYEMLSLPRYEDFDDPKFDDKTYTECGVSFIHRNASSRNQHHYLVLDMFATNKKTLQLIISNNLIPAIKLQAILMQNVMQDNNQYSSALKNMANSLEKSVSLIDTNTIERIVDAEIKTLVSKGPHIKRDVASKFKDTIVKLEEVCTHEKQYFEKMYPDKFQRDFELENYARFIGINLLEEMKDDTIIKKIKPQTLLDAFRENTESQILDEEKTTTEEVLKKK